MYIYIHILILRIGRTFDIVNQTEHLILGCEHSELRSISGRRSAMTPDRFQMHVLIGLTPGEALQGALLAPKWLRICVDLCIPD